MDSFYILKNLLDAERVAELLSMLQDAHYEDGKESATGMARNVKNNEQIGVSQVPGLLEFFNAHVVRHPLFRQLTMPRHISNIMIGRYGPGMSYGRHTDSAMLRSGYRADISFTLFLADPESYEGGELAMETAFGEKKLKLPAGSLVLYPTGILHEVKEVTAGERIVAVGWVQSRVRDSRLREILLDLDRVRADYLKKVGHDSTADLLLKTSSNLRRMWDE